MIGNLEPEENIMENSVVDQVARATNKLGWEVGDDIVVEIGGTQVSGIDVGEVYNKKWQSPKGTRKYNKEAFIVIKNLNRSPFEPSKPMDEFSPKHKYSK